MSVSRPADSSYSLPVPGQSAFRGDPGDPPTYSLFGVRIDAFTPALAARVIFEGADERRALRVVLADLWTLLLAQRDHSVWESLSAADYVLPAGDDAVVRRLTGRHHIPAVWPDQLINELLQALEQSEGSAVLMAPADEIGADMALVHQLWPRLRVLDVSMRRTDDSSLEQERLAGAVSAAQPDVLLIGGNSPWQERWTFQQRTALHVGATVMLPAVQPVLTAIAQRSGLKVPAPAWMRRRAAFQRAFEATLAPVAAASARALNELMRGPRASLQQSPLGRWHLNPASLQRMSLQRQAREARKTPATVRVAEWRGSDDSAIRRLTDSPLARLGPPRGATPLPALPPPMDERELADQPTIVFSRDELRALLPDIITGHIVELPESAGADGSAGPADASSALGAKQIAPLGDENAAARGAGPGSTVPLATSPLATSPFATSPFATSPLAPDEPPQAELSAPPQRVAVAPPLAPTTMLPGRPRRPKVDFAAHAQPASAQPVETRHAPAELDTSPAASGGLLSPAAPISASIVSPELRLEELTTLKAHLHARRRLLRRRRKLQSQRRRRDQA